MEECQRTECPLYGKKCVWPELVPSSKVLIVGEAPGRVEVERGRPFVGPSGQYLRRELKAVGVNPLTDVSYTNAVKCRPDGNATPTFEAIRTCSPNLINDIIRLKPVIVILLGRTAVTAVNLIGNPKFEPLPMASLVGRTKDMTVMGHRFTALVNYHPSFVLRNPEFKADFRLNMLKVTQYL